MDLVTFVRNQWDRVGAWVAVALGALVLLLGWLGVSDTAFPAEQIPYIVSGGLGGFFLLGLGAMLWLSADLRDEWRKLDDLDKRLALREPAPAATTSVEDAASDEDSLRARRRRPSRAATAAS